MTTPRDGAPLPDARAATHALVLVVACALLAAYHFGKVESLVARDCFRWMLEARRVAAGEVPYRDFAFVYPPLSLWVIAAAFRTMGSTFATAQIAVDLLGALLVILTWRLARRVSPPPVALGVGLVTALGGAANTGNFALFSLQIYTPSLLTGMAGLLLFLGPLVDRAQAEAHRPWSPAQLASIALGGTAACLSKVELGPAVVLACMVSALLTRRRPAGARLADALAPLVASTVPSLVAYAALAATVGPASLAEALTGYGLARVVCPWWPTLLGVFSAVAALGEAALVVSLLSLPWGRVLARAHPRRYPLLLAAAALGALAMWFELPFALQEFWKAQPRAAVWSAWARAGSVASYLLSFNGLLLPVMWTAIVLVVRALLRLVRPPRGEESERGAPAGGLEPGILVVAVAAAGVSLRGLFNHLFGDVSMVTQSSYPLWLIVLGALAHGGASFLASCSPRPARPARAGACVAVALVSYGALRFAHHAHASHAAGPYATFATAAGPVLLHGDPQGTTLYARILAITTPSSRVLELPSGGGLAFATGRRPALHSAIFYGPVPSLRVMVRDEEALRDAPPDVVVALDAPHLGSGVGLTRGCSFPRLTLVTPTCDPSRVRLPVIDAIEASYRLDTRVGDRAVLVPAGRSD